LREREEQLQKQQAIDEERRRIQTLEENERALVGSERRALLRRRMQELWTVHDCSCLSIHLFFLVCAFELPAFCPPDHSLVYPRVVYQVLETPEAERARFLWAAEETCSFEDRTQNVYKTEIERLTTQLPLMEAVTRHEFTKYRLYVNFMLVICGLSLMDVRLDVSSARLQATRSDYWAVMERH